MVYQEHTFLIMYILIDSEIVKEYTVKEVAELFGKNEETIEHWICAGKPPNSFRNLNVKYHRNIKYELQFFISRIFT